MRGFAILSGAAAGHTKASGIALKIEDGGGFDRATGAASIETLWQVGLLDAGAVRALARYHRPKDHDPRGETAAEAILRSSWRQWASSWTER